ncbi:hypothetical protein T07_12467, partial [Trichinella nelsoni]
LCRISKEFLPKFRYIEDRTRLKTGNSHEADPKNEVEASHHCTPLSLTCCIGSAVSSKLLIFHFECHVFIYSTALCVIFRINLNDHFVVPSTELPYILLWLAQK